MESGRKNVWSGGPWEDRVGYSRAVRVGPHVWVAGTTAMTRDGLVGRGDAYAQAKQAFETIGRALEEVGADLDHVVRTRMFVIDIAVNGDAVGRVHGELFGAIRPAATMLEVPRLIEHGMLVEIEVEAYVPEHKA
jgi:enamine deaminase RidA (YjgF/YER057c/UK114 family)